MTRDERLERMNELQRQNEEARERIAERQRRFEIDWLNAPSEPIGSAYTRRNGGAATIIRKVTENALAHAPQPASLPSADVLAQQLGLIVAELTRERDSALAVRDRKIERLEAQVEMLTRLIGGGKAKSALRQKARKLTEVELWPETGEKEDEFLDRCIDALTPCIGDRAEEVCADKWASSAKLGKKGFVSRAALTGNLAIEPCGKSCLACGGDKAKTDG